MTSTKASISDLEALHGALARALADKIREGTATAADMAVARQLLKDNGIDAIPRNGSPIADLAKELPYASPSSIMQDPEYH